MIIDWRCCTGADISGVTKFVHHRNRYYNFRQESHDDGHRQFDRQFPWEALAGVYADDLVNRKNVCCCCSFLLLLPQAKHAVYPTILTVAIDGLRQFRPGFRTRFIRCNVELYFRFEKRSIKCRHGKRWHLLVH